MAEQQTKRVPTDVQHKIIPEGVKGLQNLDERKKFFETLHRERGIEITDVVDTQKVFLFTISDKSEDRHRDTVNPQGWETDDYEKNPVVLWAHNTAQPPVMSSKAILKEPTALKSVAASLPEEVLETYPFARTITDMYTHGVLRMTSVGFRGLEYKIREGEEDLWWPAIDFLKQELTEYSAVPVGSNRNALLEAKAMGIDPAPVVLWAERLMQEHRGEGLWVPQEDLEGIYKDHGPGRKYFLPLTEDLGQANKNTRPEEIKDSERSVFDVSLFSSALKRKLTE